MYGRAVYGRTVYGRAVDRQKSRLSLRGGPDKLSSLRNNHMTILHSSLHKYIRIYTQYMIYIAFLVT